MIRDHYYFPVVIFKSGDRFGYHFHDFPGHVIYYCFSEEESLEMAKNYLGKHLYWMEKLGLTIPEPTPIEDLVLSENEKSFLLEINLPLYRGLENDILKWIKRRFGLAKTIITDLYQVSPYYKLVLDADKQKWIVDINIENEIVCLPLEDIKCCGEFNYKVKGNYADPIRCNKCGTELELHLLPLPKLLVYEMYDWCAQYDHLYADEPQIINDFDQRGIEFTNKIRNELREVFKEEEVFVTYVPVDQSDLIIQTYYIMDE